jgi:hypothetical protein
MKLRRYYAAMAMQGLVSGLEKFDIDKVAEVAFMIADAMIIAGAEYTCDGIDEVIEIAELDDEGEET